MIALIVSACLVSQPDTCLQDVVGWSTSGHVTACATMVNEKLPLWARAHPNYIIQGNWCQPGQGTTHSAAASADLPADCPINSRPAVMAWAQKNPGKSYWQHCRR